VFLRPTQIACLILSLTVFREMRLFDLMIFSDDSYVRIECDFSFSSLTFSDELTTLLDDEVMITSGADHLVIP
jgi:hypothetical protein